MQRTNRRPSITATATIQDAAAATMTISKGIEMHGSAYRECGSEAWPGRDGGDVCVCVCAVIGVCECSDGLSANERQHSGRRGGGVQYILLSEECKQCVLRRVIGDCLACWWCVEAFTAAKCQRERRFFPYVKNRGCVILGLSFCSYILYLSLYSYVVKYFQSSIVTQLYFFSLFLC